MNSIHSVSGTHSGFLDNKRNTQETKHVINRNEKPAQTLSSSIHEKQAMGSTALTKSENRLQILRNEHSFPQLIRSSSPSLTALLTNLHLELESNPETMQTAKLKEFVGSILNSNIELTSGDPLVQQVKNLFVAFGLLFDDQLNSAQEIQVSESQKALLANLAEEISNPLIKEKVETLLDRISGFKVQANDSGPIQQMIMQFPFSIVGKPHELTVQWEGRKKEDGSIDPSYCRMLFYLELDHLNETMVDIRVQNRIMSITIFNNFPFIQKLAEPLSHTLKNHLTKLDYHVSSLSFRSLPDVKQESSIGNLIGDQPNHGYRGVDLKI